MVAFSQAEGVALGAAAGQGGLVDLGVLDTPEGRAWHGVLAGGAGLWSLLAPDPDQGPTVASFLALAADPGTPAGPLRPAFLADPEGQARALLGLAGDDLRWLAPAGASALAPAVTDRVVGGVALGMQDAQGQNLYALATAGGRVMVVGLEPGASAVLRAELPVARDAGLEAGAEADLAAMPAGLAVVQAGQGRHLLVTLPGADTVLSYVLAPDGSAHLGGRIGAAEGMTISAPGAIAALPGGVGGLAVVGGQASGTLVVLEVGADGVPQVRDQIMDSLALRIGAVSQVQTVSYGDLSLVLAGGAERGLSLFALGPDARLYHLASTGASPGVDFATLSALEVAVEGSGLRILAAPQGADLVASLTVDLAPLGVVAAGPAAQGTARDDILIATADHAALRGGAGADLFVFSPGVAGPDGALGRVLDFDPGADRLDLSAFPMLMDLSQIALTPLPGGAHLRFRGFDLHLDSHDGAAITAADLSNAALFDAMHPPFLATGPSVPNPAPEGPVISPNFFDFLPLAGQDLPGVQSWQDWAGAAARAPAAAEVPEILGYYDLVL